MSARLSPCGQYRYTLDRDWLGDGRRGRLVWVMLNPSTADATIDDNTIRRCIRFSERWGYDGLIVVNLFALRSTNHTLLAAHPDPVGPDNDQAIAEACAVAADVIAGWGAHPMAGPRGLAVAELVDEQFACLGATAGGHHAIRCTSRRARCRFPGADHDTARRPGTEARHGQRDARCRRRRGPRRPWPVLAFCDQPLPSGVADQGVEGDSRSCGRPEGCSGIQCRQAP